MSLLELFFASLVSMFSTMISGFSGGGGALVLLILLLNFFEGSYIQMLTLAKVASASLTGASALTHRKNARHGKGYKIDKKILAAMTVPSLFSTALSMYLLQYQINEAFMVKAVPFVLFAIGAYLIWHRDLGVKVDRPLPATKARLTQTGIFFFVTSFINGFTGGMGLVFGSFLVIHYRMSMIHAIAYSMISSFIVHGLNAIYLLATEAVPFAFIVFVALGSLLGGYFGTRLQYLKGNKHVKAAALMAIFFIGLHMMIFKT